jgi:hypothetical protein
VGIYRVYTGEDGDSHLEDLSGSEHPLLSGKLPATGVFLKRFPAGTSLAPHPAPRRMVCVIVSGVLEAGFPDGTVQRFVAGDVRLMEDTHGSGHTTRVIGEEEAVIAVVALPEG